MRGYARRVTAAIAWLAVVSVAAVCGAAAPRLSPPPAAASWVVSPAAPPEPRFRWPLDGTPRVVRPFDPPAQRWLPGHRGVDLAAAPDATVRAAGAGVVRFAGVVAGRGVVSVEHRGGLRTTYEPVRPVVRSGDRVAAGDVIGHLAVGHPGCPEPACLHWGLRLGQSYLDPLGLLGLARVRLLPMAVSPRPSSPARRQ